MSVKHRTRDEIATDNAKAWKEFQVEMDMRTFRTMDLIFIASMKSAGIIVTGDEQNE